jgi:hypothetical protein
MVVLAHPAPKGKAARRAGRSAKNIQQPKRQPRPASSLVKHSTCTLQTSRRPARAPARPLADWVAPPSSVPLKSETPCAIKTTLLVMPANLVPQWQDEIEKHVAKGGRWRRAGCRVVGGAAWPAPLLPRPHSQQPHAPAPSRCPVLTHSALRPRHTHAPSPAPPGALRCCVYDPDIPLAPAAGEADEGARRRGVLGATRLRGDAAGAAEGRPLTRPCRATPPKPADAAGAGATTASGRPVRRGAGKRAGDSSDGGGGGGRGGGGEGLPPIMCRGLDGGLVAMHTCDICLLSYEHLRTWVAARRAWRDGPEAADGPSSDRKVRLSSRKAHFIAACRRPLSPWPFAATPAPPPAPQRALAAAHAAAAVWVLARRPRRGAERGQHQLHRGDGGKQPVAPPRLGHHGHGAARGLAWRVGPARAPGGGSSSTAPQTQPSRAAAGRLTSHHPRRPSSTPPPQPPPPQTPQPVSSKVDEIAGLLEFLAHAPYYKLFKQLLQVGDEGWLGAHPGPSLLLQGPKKHVGWQQPVSRSAACCHPVGCHRLKPPKPPSPPTSPDPLQQAPCLGRGGLPAGEGAGSAHPLLLMSCWRQRPWAAGPRSRAPPNHRRPPSPAPAAARRDAAPQQGLGRGPARAAAVRARGLCGDPQRRGAVRGGVRSH